MYIIILWFSSLVVLNSGGKSSDIFHENSKITFNPNLPSEYFGFSVLMDASGLRVGAPKAKSRSNPNINPGLMFRCPLNIFESNVTCNPVEFIKGIYQRFNLFTDNMWFGATIATISNDTSLSCAPLSVDPQNLLPTGDCITLMGGSVFLLKPLETKTKNSFTVYDDKIWRPEYGAVGYKLDFYNSGQAGMSMKVTENNDLFIGAPGLLQRTGAVIEYKLEHKSKRTYFKKQIISNPYFTKDLNEDDYLGYSVESGIFDNSQKGLIVAGAPRSKSGYGQVLIYEPVKEEKAPLNIKASLTGPQLGSYFGASVCCIDINGDGTTDLLVGAPNFVSNEGESYDEGAVFVYLTQKNNTSFIMKNTKYVTGSGSTGARFGTTLIDLGDLDDDGFKEIAVGAPWEDGGSGVVYVYSSNNQGLKSDYMQRILAEGAKGFGLSISKGYDLDKNGCNDLAVGAYKSESVYVYRCVPTIKVTATITNNKITVPDSENLTQNTTEFIASFCITTAPNNHWKDLSVDLDATISFDPSETRAHIADDLNYKLAIKPGRNRCVFKYIKINNTADFVMPILLNFDLVQLSTMRDSLLFLPNAVRLSSDSVLTSRIDIQVTGDCGDDLICTPWLELNLEPRSLTFVSGADSIIGLNVIVSNTEEPAYGVKVNLTLPLIPKRIPSTCTLQEINLICSIPPGLIGQSEWKIELEPPSNVKNRTTLIFEGFLVDAYSRNISDGIKKEATVEVLTKSTFVITGNVRPNITLQVTREKFDKGENVFFTHYVKVTNYGPSDCSSLKADIQIPEKVALLKKINDCEEKLLARNLECSWIIPANYTLTFNLDYYMDLKTYGKFLEEKNTYNFTTTITLLLEDRNLYYSVTTTIALEQLITIWYYVVAGVVVGLTVLILSVYGLYKCGFFARTRAEQNVQLISEEKRNVNSPDENSDLQGSKQLMAMTKNNLTTSSKIDDTSENPMDLEVIKEVE